MGGDFDQHLGSHGSHPCEKRKETTRPSLPKFPDHHQKTLVDPPSGPYGPQTKAWSWLARILPYAEQNNLYRQAGIPSRTLYEARDVVATPVNLYLCPSDSSGQPRDDAADLGIWNPPFIAAAPTNYKE